MPKRSTFPYHNGLGITFGRWWKDETMKAPERDLFRWEFKYCARQSVCTEWLAFTDWIVRYPNTITLKTKPWINYEGEDGYDDWEIYAVVAGKHRSSSRLLLYKAIDGVWRSESIHLDGPSDYNLIDPGLLNHIRSFQPSPYRHYCENVAAMLGTNYRLHTEEKGTEMGITVETNEYKDPDSSIITITSGRSSINLTLKEAMEVLSQIPTAVDAYRTARRDSIAEQIKELQSQLALMDKAVPTQTSAPAISQPF